MPDKNCATVDFYCEMGDHCYAIDIEPGTLTDRVDWRGLPIMDCPDHDGSDQ